MANSAHSTAGTGQAIIETAAILIVLGWTAACTAQSGPGFAVKVGAQTLEDPVDLDKTARARLELELSSPLLFDEHVDFALAFGGSFLGTHTETYTDTVDGTFIDDLYTDRLWLLDIRLAARLYPLGDSSRIRPYVGAGVGYFWFRDHWENEYSDTFEDPLSPGTFLTVTDTAKGTANLAQGFFPFVVAGVTVPLSSRAELMAEFQYDFDKKNSGFDFGGPIYMLGGRFRF
jgi:outer membrane protein W